MVIPEINNDQIKYLVGNKVTSGDAFLGFYH